MKTTDESRFMRTDDIAKVMRCSKSKAQKIMKQLNDELKAKGYITVSGRVNRTYFEERTGLKC